MSTSPDPQDGSADTTPLVSCTIAEASSRLGISKRAVMRQIQNGTLAAERDEKQWAVMLPASLRSAETNSAQDQLASALQENQPTGASAGGLLAGPIKARQGRPQAQIEQAIERLGAQHSIKLSALTEQIRQRTNTAGVEHTSRPEQARPFEHELEMPPASDRAGPEQDPPAVAAPLESSQPAPAVPPAEPTQNEPAAPTTIGEQQWETLFRNAPVLPAQSDSSAKFSQASQLAQFHQASVAVPSINSGWRDRIGEWWQDLISRYAYRSRLILAMIGVALLLGAILGCMILLLLYVPSRGQTNGVILAATALPAQVATSAVQAQATTSATPATLSTASRAITSTAPTEAAPNLAATSLELATNAPAATSISRSDSIKAMLQRVALAEASLRRGQIIATISNTDGTGAWAETRFDLGDATRPPALHITSTYTGTTGVQTIERIIIGDRTWERTADGHWSTRPAREGIDDQMRVFLPHADSVADADLEMNNDLALLRWHERERSSDITLIVEPTTGIPRELRQATRATGAVRIVTYSRWNTAVDISPPEEN